MTTRQPKVHTQLGRAAVQILAANERMNQILIEHLDHAAWRVPGPCRSVLRSDRAGPARVKKFRRDGLARPWPVGPEMLCYMLSHESTIAGRCVCSRINSDSRCRLR